MKRRVWIKIVSCLLLVSLLAGGETVLFVGAEAETWPQETSVDEQGRTIKKVPAENGKTDVWELVGIFGGEDEALKSIGIEKTKKAEIGDQTCSVEMEKVGEKESEEYIGALEEMRFRSSKFKAKARKKTKTGTSAEQTKPIKWAKSERGGSISNVGTQTKKVVAKKVNRRGKYKVKVTAGPDYYKSFAKPAMIKIRNLQEDAKELADSGTAVDGGTKKNGAPDTGMGSGDAVTTMSSKGIMTLFKKMVGILGRVKKMTTIVGWTDPANLIYLQDNQGSGL